MLYEEYPAINNFVYSSVTKLLTELEFTVTRQVHTENDVVTTSYKVEKDVHSIIVSERTYGELEAYQDNSFPLIRFYHENGLPTLDLLQCDAAVIRTLSFDKDYRLPQWLQAHNLVLPKCLMKPDDYGKWSTIAYLSEEVGIEYLRRKVLSKPAAKQQSILDKVVALSRYELEANMLRVLADSLVSEQCMPFGDMTPLNDRFKAFREKQALSQITIDSSSSSVEVDTDTLNGDGWESVRIDSPPPSANTSTPMVTNWRENIMKAVRSALPDQTDKKSKRSDCRMQ